MHNTARKNGSIMRNGILMSQSSKKLFHLPFSLRGKKLCCHLKKGFFSSPLTKKQHLSIFFFFVQTSKLFALFLKESSRENTFLENSFIPQGQNTRSYLAKNTSSSFCIILPPEFILLLFTQSLFPPFPYSGRLAVFESLSA